jgi:cell wall assembly regulator SMI1
MSNNWTAQFLNLVETHEEIRMSFPVTDETIEEAESILEVVFPLQLKIYLKTFGRLEIGYHDLYGVGSTIPDYLSIVKETLSERKEFRPYIPVHLLPIENDGSGNHYCLDVSSVHDDPPVVFWNHENDEEQIPEPVSNSFTSWLFEIANESFEA